MTGLAPMVSADEYRAVALDLLVKARALRVAAVREQPKTRNRMRADAARLERISRFLEKEADTT